jgi:GMP synthase-like glutamine amidotransferase
MRIAYLQHVPYEGPGSIAAWAQARGHDFVAHHVYRGDALPDPQAWDALVVMGGPMGVHDQVDHPWLHAEKACIQGWLAADRPVLGICLGAQLLADVLGAGVRRSEQREIGWFPLRRLPDAQASWLGQILPAEFEVFHWHGDTFAMPSGAVALAASDACANQGFVHEERVVGLQFHLEMDLATAQSLVDNTEASLAPAPYVQPPEVMLSQPERFATLRGPMFRLLDHWAALR